MISGTILFHEHADVHIMDHEVDRLRSQAELACWLAKMTTDEKLAQHLIDIARQYQEEADRLHPKQENGGAT